MLHASEVESAAVFSIFSSAMAIAFASSTISLDHDIDPARRVASPSFYGYLPNENRMAIFLLMMMMSASHALLKVIACSLMLKINQAWFLLYMLGDMSLYLIYKIVRGELRYSLRLSGALSWVGSIAFRVIAKIVTDL